MTVMAAAQALDQRRLTNEGLRAVLIRITPGFMRPTCAVRKTVLCLAQRQMQPDYVGFREQFVERHKRCVGEGRAAATLPRVAVHDWLLVRLSGLAQRNCSEEKSGSKGLVHPRRARSRKRPGFIN